MTGRTCTLCEKYKEAEHFTKCAKLKCGLYSWCKACTNSYAKEYRKAYTPILRSRERLKNYGVTEAQYQELLEKQQWACAACLEVTTLCVDHCHRTGKVRGLLCHQMQQSFGVFKRQPINNK